MPHCRTKNTIVHTVCWDLVTLSSANIFLNLQVNEKQKQTNKKFIETQSDIQANFFSKSEAEHYPTSNDLEIRKSGYLKNFLCLAFELILL